MQHFFFFADGVKNDVGSLVECFSIDKEDFVLRRRLTTASHLSYINLRMINTSRFVNLGF